MIGVSSGAAGCAFAESCLPDGGFAALLPPLIERSTGWLLAIAALVAVLAAALAGLSALLLDNLLLGISRPLISEYPRRLHGSGWPRYDRAGSISSFPSES